MTGSTTRPPDDLLHWEPRKLIREAELLQTYKCGDRDPACYPSVLDPRSGSRNFETTGRTPVPVLHALPYKRLPADDQP